ncbi:SpaH/EbpB family LPXTG-anchored major pilin [uncultured Helcococcus sp.]|uniref:SpaH/EbpB family LPXTG-anchored major pilin n=1 Tax=uncultured Helcococcus sp. TaxID=1072508 RepID=UPI0026040576|nr:SpaH/EbpB family LPXTG-anchored major pilin [uncultured Helcococcus sp.]
MKTKLNRLYALVLSLLMIITASSTVFAANQNLANHTTKLTIHKLQYMNSNEEGQYIEKKNTGKEMNISDFGTEAKVWDKSKNGEVGFSIFKLDKEKVLESNLADNNPQAIADAVEKDNTAYGATKVNDQLTVDENGLVSFENLEEGRYVVVETLSSSTVTQKAKAMFISLPLNNDEANGYLDEVHLYPKNKVEEKTQELVKYVLRNGEADSKAYEGAKFDLYKGLPGQGTKVNQKDLVTNGEGKISVNGLEVGSYYFVESSVADADLIEGQANKVLLNQEVVNEATNKLTFEYKNDGSIVYPEGSLLAEGKQVINYEKPTIKKEATDERPVKSYNIGDEISYKVTVDVPHNITSYKTFNFTDKADKALTVDVNSINIEGLTKGTDYQVSEIDGGYQLDFTPANLAAFAGKQLTVTYKATINDQVEFGKPVNNTVELNFDNNTETGKEKDNEEVFTYSHKLVKKGQGLFNTGIAKENLSGAEFKIYRQGENGVEYLKKSDNKVEWVADKNEATVYTTGEDGSVVIEGLKAGSYVAEEIKAPVGYNLPTNPTTEFTVSDKEEGQSEWTVSETEIINEKSPDMPMTGTEKTVLVIAGLAALTVVGFVISKRNKEQA